MVSKKGFGRRVFAPFSNEFYPGLKIALSIRLSVLMKRLPFGIVVKRVSNDPLLLGVKVGVYGIARAGGLGGGHAYGRNVFGHQIGKIGG